jgi:hypothetical protein
MHGVGLNRKLQTLDLSGCSFTLNSSPAYIRELMKNKSLREVVLPDPRTLTFRCHSDNTLNDLVEVAGVWELNSTSPAAQMEFASFAAAGGGAGAFAANLRELASVKVARHNRHLQDLAVRSTLAFNVSDFLAKHYSDSKALARGLIYDRGFIPLQVAALRWDASAIAAFCQEADDVNALNADGDTALHCMLIDLGQGIAKMLADDPDQSAWAQRFLGCVKMLIDAGADPTLPDVEGNTFLDGLLGFVGGNAAYPTIPKVWEPVLAEVLRYINQPRPAGSGLAVPVVNL